MPLSIHEKEFDFTDSNYFDKSNTFFIIGEEHRSRGNSHIQAALFKELSTNHNINYLLIEACHSKAFLIEQYFQGKLNEQDIFWHPLWLDEGEKKLFLELKKHYQKFPFRLIGLEKENDNSKAHYALSQLIRSDSMLLQNERFKKFVESNDTFFAQSEAKHSIDSLVNFVELNKSKLGSAFFDLKLILRSYQVSYIPTPFYHGRKANWKINIINANAREEFIFNSILFCYKEIKDFKAVCIYGSYHSPKIIQTHFKGIINFETFTTKLQKSKINVCSMKIISGNLSSRDARNHYSPTMNNLEQMNQDVAKGEIAIKRLPASNLYHDFVIVNKLNRRFLKMHDVGAH